jgi:hypothetical protein
MSTAKRPNNWPKWKEIVGDTDEEDVKEFADWYSSYYSDFGRLDTDSLFSISKNMLSHNRESDEENSKTYDRLYPHFGAKSSKSRYLSSEGMETLKSAFRRGSQIDEKVQDLSESDFGLIANLVALSSTFFTYDKKKEKFVPVLKVIFDEILTDEELSKLKSEESLGSSDESSDFVVVLDKKQGIRKANKQDKGSGESRNKKVFEENLKIANLIHLPLLQKHVSRMNAKTWDDLSKDASDGIYKVPSE